MQSRHLVEHFSRQCPVCKKPRPSFICGSVGAFSLPFWGYLNRGAHCVRPYCSAVCPLPGHWRKCSAGKLFFAGRRAKAVSRQFGQTVAWVVAEKSWLFTAHGRDAARPDTVPSRLPGACAASAPRAGHWRTRLRYRRHWPPGPWRNGRIWSCPWPGRPGASIR